jgi:hypothetical protein
VLARRRTLEQTDPLGEDRGPGIVILRAMNQAVGRLYVQQDTSSKPPERCRTGKDHGGGARGDKHPGPRPGDDRVLG